MKTKLTSDQERRLVALYVQHRIGIAMLARRFGCSDWTVREALDRAQVRRTVGKPGRISV